MQWEFYRVLVGSGTLRYDGGSLPIAKGPDGDGWRVNSPKRGVIVRKRDDRVGARSDYAFASAASCVR